MGWSLKRVKKGRTGGTDNKGEECALKKGEKEKKQDRGKRKRHR